MLGVDPRRFGSYVTKSYLMEKNEEAYANVFTVHYPDEESEAGRPLRQAPCYDRMKKLGAVFGQKFGWERPNFFATDGENKKMIGHLEDQIGLRVLRKSAKRKRKCWYIRYVCIWKM